MSGENQNGFTVIETVIFIAVSSLLFIGVLVGTGTAIARQRYTDSVRTTESFLQQQIDRTMNFANTRDGSQVCNNAGAIASGVQAPGTSNCFVLGKALRFTQGASTVQVHNVIGTEPNTIVQNGTYIVSADETAVLNAYTPRAVMNVAVETYEAPWLARFVGASQNPTSPYSPINTVLFLRSPRSGGLLTYTTTWPGGAPSGGTMLLTGAINASALQKFARICMESQDLPGVNNRSAIELTGRGGQSAIQAKFEAVTGAECLPIP